MLTGMRQAAESKVAKVLLPLLVLSFLVWGVGGFQGYGAGTVATVGDTEVTVDEFARALDQASRSAQQAGQQPDPQQILSGLMIGAALDDVANDYNLGVSDDRVARTIAENPAFHGGGGGFDHDRFAALLQNARIDRDVFVQDTRQGLVRTQIVDSIGAGFSAPRPVVEAIYRLQNEERTISYFTVDESAIDPVGDPSASLLQTYFDDNKGSFRAPEYRKLALLMLDPAAIADPAAVSEEEVAAEYERRKASFTRPERRRLEQIRFASAAAANEAVAAIQSGKDFMTVAAENGLAPTDIDQGLKTKAEILDPAVATAAFAAEPDRSVAVTEGAIEPVVIRVTAIEPGSVTPLAEVEARLRQDIAARSARDRIEALYDAVEDERAAGATLAEAADKLKLPYRVVDAVSADLKTPAGATISDLPNGTAVVREAYDSDVGVENSPIRNGDGWVFFDVLDITPERDRTLDEVRDEVALAWRAEETRKRIAERAEALFDRLRNGTPPAALAAEIGKSVAVIEQLKRGAPPAGLTQNAAAQAFAGPEGHVANAEGTESSRILLRVDGVVAPAFFPEAAGVDAVESRLADSLRDEVVATFNLQLLDGRATSINNNVYQQVTGQLQAR